MRTKYVLGAGGMDPHLPSPGGICDCSGFVAWCLGLSRKPKPSRPWWIETTAMVRDATGQKAVFAFLDGPEPGCVVVYGDKGGHQGHTGIVTVVRSPRDYDVVDCSSGSWKREQDAIVEHTGIVFRQHGAIFVALKEDLV